MEEYMIRGACYAAGVLSMAVWHGVHMWMSNRRKPIILAGIGSVNDLTIHNSPVEIERKGTNEVDC